MMGPEQQAHFIGRFAALFDEAFATTKGGPEAYALLLELSMKALISIADDPQAAMDGLLMVARQESSQAGHDQVMRMLGLKRHGD